MTNIDKVKADFAATPKPCQHNSPQEVFGVVDLDLGVPYYGISGASYALLGQLVGDPMEWRE